MTWIVQNLWLIPALPLLAAGVTALLEQRHRTLAASLAIGSMVLAFFLACGAFVQTLGGHGEGHEAAKQVFNIPWFQLGSSSVMIGWVLDPLTASMLVMVTFVSTLIFIYSVGYMAHDENFTRFFTFLSLFAAAMLGIVIANSLLMLFVCWELVGLASYLLIGFWYHKPSAAAAAKKAFITTRVGDVFFFLGLLWLYAETGTLLFYDNGNGCLEQSALTKLVGQTAFAGMGLSTAIALLLFCGAIGKSGQVPLHVWLPDAMEGPTPVSALIHAATMVAAGVFLMARVFPLLGEPSSVAREVVTWVGAITAIFAALVAVAQTDIKRILAYSTVSQLGFMFIGLGAGGVAVGMFHLLTHAFFKALLFLGAGSVIHGCHDEQDIRRMGGLRKFMPVTFATYAIGMMALSGVPLLFSGFWSKDEILHSALAWSPSKIPFVLGLAGAFLTAFYMTRQMWFVFFGEPATTHAVSNSKEAGHGSTQLHGAEAHESPRLMTVPLTILAACAVLLSVVGTPAWPWLESYLNGHAAIWNLARLFESGTLVTMIVSAIVAGAGIATGWIVYSRSGATVTGLDPLAQTFPKLFRILENRFFFDELYQATVIRLTALLGLASHWMDRLVWGGVVEAVSWIMLGVAWVNRFLDENVVNGGFDGACDSVRVSSRVASRFQGGQVQAYMKVIAIGLVVLTILALWGWRS
ncbi:MAG: NADH-quinone oxidoreductase subunit L [Pedosphaera sp.]|nr:NADH-quinone oxidoreductase subunit L [Pedosphaera sp.]